MKYINITTPNNVTINYKLAGISDRIIAYILDNLIIGFYSLLMILVLAAINISANTFILIALLAPALFYHLLFEYFMHGQSPGKRIMNIKVTSTDGSALKFGSYLIRWILRLIDLLISSGTIATLTILIGGRGQRLGDIAAGTIVVKNQKNSALSSTIYQNIPEGYSPKYKTSILLNDTDIKIIKKALKVRNSENGRVVITKAQQAIATKMRVTPDESPVSFLNNVLRDYNYFNS